MCLSVEEQEEGRVQHVLKLRVAKFLSNQATWPFLDSKFLYVLTSLSKFVVLFQDRPKCVFSIEEEAAIQDLSSQG